MDCLPASPAAQGLRVTTHDGRGPDEQHFCLVHAQGDFRVQGGDDTAVNADTGVVRSSILSYRHTSTSYHTYATRNPSPSLRTPRSGPESTNSVPSAARPALRILFASDIFVAPPSLASLSRAPTQQFAPRPCLRIARFRRQARSPGTPRPPVTCTASSRACRRSRCR
ncbi:hypothetical protein OH77DRAFT_1420151 [Trametes cingulata]|nr:hypothetical protein OH77DRAFT_1420151 [Trametes cingulata]